MPRRRPVRLPLPVTLVAGVLSVATSLTGCQAVSKVVTGETSTVVAATADRVGPVAEAVVRDKGLADVQATVTQLDAVVTGSTAEGKLITVTVTPAGTRTSKVAVSNKAGKVIANSLLREIESRVDDAAADATPPPSDAPDTPGAPDAPAIRYVPAPTPAPGPSRLVADPAADDGDTPPNPFE